MTEGQLVKVQQPTMWVNSVIIVLNKQPVDTNVTVKTARARPSIYLTLKSAPNTNSGCDYVIYDDGRQFRVSDELRLIISCALCARCPPIIRIETSPAVVGGTAPVPCRTTRIPL